MALTSTQITTAIKQEPNPAQAEFETWKKVRYLVAQKPAAADSKVTNVDFYKGCAVIPGPKGNPQLVPQLTNAGLTLRDFQILKERHFIRFTDTVVTDNATDGMGQALFRPMSSSEADDFEKPLIKEWETLNGEKFKRVSSKTTK